MGLHQSIDFGGIELWLAKADDDEQSISTYAPTVVIGAEPVELTAEMQFDIEVLQEQLLLARDELSKKDYQSAETLFRETQDTLQNTHTTLRPFRMELIQYYIAKCLLLQRDAQKLAEARQNCCLLYTSPSPRDRQKSRMPSSA